MPKKIHDLPADRADYTFGDLFYWHCFVFGSRPDIRPTDPTGRPWYPKAVRDALDLKSVKTIWNYVDEKSLPFDTVAIETMLFGGSQHYDKERLELRQRLSEAREGSGKKAAGRGGALVPMPSGGLIRYAVEYEDDAAEADDAEVIEVLPAGREIIGKDRKSTALEPAPVVVPPVGRLFVRAGQMGLVVFGLFLAAYAWRSLTDSTSKDATPQVAAVEKGAGAPSESPPPQSTAGANAF